MAKILKSISQAVYAGISNVRQDRMHASITAVFPSWRENLDSSDGRVRDNVHEAGNREVHLDVRRGGVIRE